ncbi:pilus assembly protein TadG-related protein [Aeoliella mucimassa]|uniref:pilus assembly protein TadG-related protein n=1 Tax=Aeoliella mucimassa TaxID=2527972 RepID=UPI0018D4A3D5|nr:pilus assembly protein TadG-related protein [Aeoliella mucimassa]
MFRHRRGALTILAAVFCVVLLGMVAFAVDIGYVLSSKEEIQRTADASALAAAWEFIDRINEGYDPADAQTYARQEANTPSAANFVGTVAPAVDLNPSNTPSGDLVFGYISDFTDPNIPFDTTQPDRFNAVRVKVRRDENVNGELPLFFARIFGNESQAIEAYATAALARDVDGFEIPSDGSWVEILPIALDYDTWVDWKNGVTGSDGYTYNKETGSVAAGGDGRLEVNLYPQGNGSPGNRGMVDIGSNNNSTADIARQIVYGISPEDLAHHGGSLVFDQCGKLYLNGDTGISAGVKDELASIIGDPRVIPIFEEVNGPGNNAIYTIVAWQGIRIMDVKLTGPMRKKHVTIQMAPAVGRGVIPATTVGGSSYVYSPVILIE